MIATRQFRACDVCRLLDYNMTPKDCGYCSLCDAFICLEDEDRWDRRIKAALKRRMEIGFGGDPTYADKLTDTGELKP